MEIPITLGYDKENNLYKEDLKDLENILIGGQTGSGKSVFFHSIICSLLSRFSPNQCRFLLIDPKMVEFSVYEGLAHLYLPTISNPKKALEGLQAVVNEVKKRAMDKRRLPHIIVVIDTFSDLFYHNPREFQKKIEYITANGPKANIFLLMSDSRVGSELYTDKILNCFKTKIAFKTFDDTGSNLLIKIPDAKDLAGYGDILFLPSEKNNPIRLQGTNITDDDIYSVKQKLI